MTIYRTLADPAYLDLTIDPDDRPLGSLFAFPDPFDANAGRGGLARTMTIARLALDVVGTVVDREARGDHAERAHPVARRASRPPTPRSASAKRARSPTPPDADDITYHELPNAPHYLEGHRPEAMAFVAEWIAKRFP